MTKKNLFYRPWSWIIVVLVAIASIFYVYQNFNKANPLVSLDIRMSREEALQAADRLAEEFAIGPESFKQAAGFRKDARFQNFTELEAGGLDTFNHVVAEGYYSPFYWTVRHFQEQEPNEAVFWFKPSGETYGFREKIPESEPGEALGQEEALRIAEHHAIYNWDVDLTPYRLEEKSQTEQLSGRIDHTFVYERTDRSVGEGKYRLKLVVSGDKLSSVDYFVKIPENFGRRYSEMRSANQTLQMISMAAIALLYGLLGVVLGIFVLMRKRRLVWKPALFWGMGIALASVFLLTLNSLPFAWFSYDTSTSQSNFLIRQILNGLMAAVGFGAIISVSFMAGEGLGRMAFPRHIQWWKLWSSSSGGSLPVLGQTVAGYLFAVIILAFDVLFYVTTKTHLGWWSPAGNLSDPNVLATYLPWLDSIAISLQAGFWEEALFRAVPIAGVFLLTKGKKSRPFWIVVVLLVQTLIFGAAHANYPQQPSYARVIEMIIPFTVMGIIYIYYGILPAVMAHYAVDVFWISLPLWVSSSSGIWVDRALVLFFLFLPLFIVFYFRFKNKKWTKVPESERNGGWKVPPPPEEKPLEKENFIEPRKFHLEKWLLPLGAAGLVLWAVFAPFRSDAPALSLPREEAVEVAKQELRDKYAVDFDQWTILTSVSDNVDMQNIFAWRTGGKASYQSLLGNFLDPPHWIIRVVKTSGEAEDRTEEFRVDVFNDGMVRRVSHKIPEDQPGKNLTREEAQQIADAALRNRYSLDRRKLKEIAVSPEKLEDRTDWELTYADTINYPLEQGQGRYRVKISGDEVTDAYAFVHIPEEWSREYREANSKKSVFRTIGNVLVSGTLLLGLILGIIRWTRKKFRLKLFISFTLLFATFFILENWMGWNSILSNYSTQIPMSNFITMILIGLALGGIFLSLFNGIIMGVTPGWIPVSPGIKANKLIYAIALGFLVAGIWTALGQIAPKTSPSWLNFNYMNSTIPWLSAALSKISTILVYPAFVMVLFYGIHFITRAWTTGKWIGILIFALAGFALGTLDFETLYAWILWGVLAATALWALYFFFIRFHFEWIPVGFGILLLFEMLREMIANPQLNFVAGGILMILISSGLLYIWSVFLLKYPEQTPPE